MQTFIHNHVFHLEAGGSLPQIEIAYHTYGSLNKDGSNVVWACHALTASSSVMEWWPGVVGENCVIDPSKYFIVCANIIGSCYGSTGPLSINPETGKPYYHQFPVLTIRDMVRAHILLKDHLAIKNIHLLAGGSMGGYQALEWALMEPGLIDQLFLLATSATESAWGIAVHTAQRLAIEADSSWNNSDADAGKKGMKAARAVGMLSYRNYSIMVKTQSETSAEKFDDYKAASYINYQGDKLVNRFNAFSYWSLTRSLDSHHITRGRGGNTAEVLKTIKQRTLIIGISSDILCPVTEQQLLASSIPDCRLIEIDSIYGHDGFLVEAEKISTILKEWL